VSGWCDAVCGYLLYSDLQHLKNAAICILAINCPELFVSELVTSHHLFNIASL
jgi:hypothetical protein